jgi:hypothetical protein
MLRRLWIEQPNNSTMSEYTHSIVLCFILQRQTNNKKQQAYRKEHLVQSTIDYTSVSKHCLLDIHCILYWLCTSCKS